MPYCCKKCGFEPCNQSELHEHHIVPKALGGTDIDGRILLCGENKGNDCHKKLHAWLREQPELKEFLKRLTKKWIDEKCCRNNYRMTFSDLSY